MRRLTWIISGILCGFVLASLMGPMGKAATSQSPSPKIAALKATFHSRGRTWPLEIVTSHVAVRESARFKSHALPMSAPERERFEQMGVRLVAQAEAAKTSDRIGYPVWFDKDQGAIGILTAEIVVRVATPDAVTRLRKVPGFTSATALPGRSDILVATFNEPLRALEVANALSQQRDIVYAHPDFWLPKDWRGALPRSPRPSTSNEALFEHQWHLQNTGQFGGQPGADIHVLDAWNVTTGDPNVVIAVLDGGFDVRHHEFDGAWFVNSGEIPGNGVDDDGNGYVDDVSGWNFYFNTPDPAIGFTTNHGTAVAGLVAARRDGRGVDGVCPQCRMLPISMAFQPSMDAAAFHYVTDMGAAIISNSWGYQVGTPLPDVVVDAVNRAAHEGRGGLGAIVLFAMNNLDHNDCIGSTPDISSLESVVAISASSDLDKKVARSAWGECMELLAPSRESVGNRKGIATTDRLGTSGINRGTHPDDLKDVDYTNRFEGTSAATPIVSGAFGLMLSVNDRLTRDEAVAMMLAAADKVSPELANYDARTGFSLRYGYGRVNAARAVRSAELLRRYTKRNENARPEEERAVRR